MASSLYWLNFFCAHGISFCIDTCFVSIAPILSDEEDEEGDQKSGSVKDSQEVVPDLSSDENDDAVRDDQDR